MAINIARARAIVGARQYDYEQDLDGYATPPAAVIPLLHAVPFYGDIWEPACGDGAVCKVLEAAGHTVVATDLIDRGYAPARTPIDFLGTSRLAAPNIITNPPFTLALDFAEHALAMGPDRLALLLRLQWLEGVKRRAFFAEHPPEQVLVFSKRLPRMHRFDYTGKKTTSTLAMAWFVWRRGHNADPVLRWL